MAFNRTDRSAEARAMQQLRDDGVVRLVFIGENPDNISGKSNKFYEVTSYDRLCTARWGKVGARGQMMALGSHFDATQKIRSKLRRGYELAADLGDSPSTTASTLTLTERIAAATFRAVTPARWVSNAAGKGLIEVTVANIGGHDYRLYTDLAGTKLWVLTRGPQDGLKHAYLGAR